MQAEEYDSPRSRAQWSSEPAFIFSMATAAVGLGTIWRFPYMVVVGADLSGGAHAALHRRRRAAVAGLRLTRRFDRRARPR